jgi:hypothetical protein
MEYCTPESGLHYSAAVISSGGASRRLAAWFGATRFSSWFLYGLLVAFVAITQEALPKLSQASTKRIGAVTCLM